MKQSCSNNHSPRTVLLVEDDPDIRIILKKILEAQGGYKVEEAANGKVALERLDNEGLTPCMIFLDLMMPVMDGWTFIKEKIKRSVEIANIPTVVLTASRAAMPDNVEKILRKPVAMKDVLATCEDHC